MDNRDEIEKLHKLLLLSYDEYTCFPSLRCKWSTDNVTLGQCAVTALIVNDYFGGKIMRCMTSSGSHYYNMIDDSIVDFTVSQFMGECPMYESGEERTREYLLSDDSTKIRYNLLLSNLENVKENKKMKIKKMF